MIQRVTNLCASGCGIGYLSWAPGTWASAATVFIWWMVPIVSRVSWSGMVIFAGVSTVIAHYAQKYDGHRDPSWIVIDEVVGMSVALWGLPHHWMVYGGAFVLFRALDIAKPCGIRKLEQLPGGYGVVCDDLASGILTRLIVFIFTGF